MTSHVDLRVLRRLCVLLALTACTPAIGVTSARAIDHATTLGITSRSLLQLPRDYSTVVGVQADALAQIAPASIVDQERLSAVLGYGGFPDPHASWLGALVLGRLGIARGSYGRENTPIAFLAGASLELPIRLFAREAPWKADSVVDVSLVLLPSFDVTELYALDVSNRFATELGGSLSLGLRLWSGLVP
jgi:hypothetical protein